MNFSGFKISSNIYTNHFPSLLIEVNEFQTIVESIHANMNRMAMKTEHEKLKAIGLRIQLEHCQHKETAQGWDPRS